MRKDWREDSPRGLLTGARDFQVVAEDALSAHTKRAVEYSPLSERSPSVLELDPPSVAVFCNFLSRH